MIKILIAEDQEIIRESFKIILGRNEKFELIDTVSDGNMVLESIGKKRPDVILMDVRMPKMDGVQCTKYIKENYPEIKVIILTTFDDEEFIYDAFKYGADGYLLKSLTKKELEKAITKVYNGDYVINSPEVMNKVVNMFSRFAKSDFTHSMNVKNIESITDTEWKIIYRIKCGESNKEISLNMNLSKGTIRNYLSSILNKLELRDRTQLAIWAVQSNVREQ
ncbi:MAG: response regulator [Lachnospirales bacterium]